MSYAPTTNNNSGQILAQGINAGADNITAALDGIMKKRQEATSAIAAMDMLASLNPEALPRDPTGQVDAKFLEKFYSAPLAAQQQTLGLITSKLLMTPEDKARIGATNAQADLMKAQAEIYKGEANAAANAVSMDEQIKKQNLSYMNEWGAELFGLNKPASKKQTRFAGPELPADPVTDLPPLPDVLPPLK